MRARAVSTLLSLLLVAACSSKGTARPTSTGARPDEPSPAASARVEVRALTVRFEGMPIARLHADGRSESVGDERPENGRFTPGPRFHADGTIELTKGGVRARLEPNGDLVWVVPSDAGQPDKPFARLTDDRLELAGARDAGVRLDGAKLVMFHAGKPTSVIGEVEPPSMGRTALLMTAAFFMDLELAAR
jgi:hypothetical protein